MEIEGSDGSRTLFKMGLLIEFGRGSGFITDDRTVSRRHVSFRVNPVDESMAEFKVIGKNPIWVHSCKSRQASTFRTSESGEMEIGDMFCVSAKNPTWFALKKAQFEAVTENTVKSELDDFKSQSEESLENKYHIKDVVGLLELESIDIFNIDPIKEFGFLVIGKEFDSYPKKRIRDIKNWNWFIEDPRVGNEEDDDKLEEKKKRRRKRKNRREENKDEEWTGESEEKEQLTNTRKIQRPNKYVTRSRDRHESSKDINTVSNVNVKRVENEDEDKEEEEEDDETLGGFIVDDDDIVEEEAKEIDDDNVDEEEDDDDDEDDEFHD